MAIVTSTFQDGVIDIIASLLEFFNKMKPNPFVAIAAIEAYRIKLLNDEVFGITIEEISTQDEEVDELLSLLDKFIEETKEKIKKEAFTPPKPYIIPPAIYFITALEVAKYNFLAETI